MENKKTWIPVKLLVPVFLAIMAVVPALVATVPAMLAQSMWAKIAAIAVALITSSIAYVATACLLSMPFHKAIVAGKFPRDVGHFVYGPRRLYGLCWGAVFYCTPIYYAFLSVPFLRNLMFRGFGYNGHPDINVAPDAWIRDLPMLQFGKGVYTSNKCTIGTNICLADGSLMVDKVTLGEHTTIGHLGIIGLGSSTQAGCEIGIGCAVGLRVKMGQKVRVSPTTSINHGAQIGSNVEIGAMSYIGVKVRIADGIKLPGGSNVPEGMDIQTQEDVRVILSSETNIIQMEAKKLAEIYAARGNPGEIVQHKQAGNE